MRPVRSSAILFLVLTLTILHRAIDPANLLPLVASAQSANDVGTGVERRPNLIPDPAGFVHIETCDDPNAPDSFQRIPGSTCLRFDTTAGNFGAGPLELRPGEVVGNGKQRVYQRVYKDDCTYQDYVSGEFVYHPQHQHFHFEGYGVYELQPVGANGGSKRIGGKTSFCVLDTTVKDLNLAGSPGSSMYIGCSTFQGMSMGWGDTYSYFLYGQQIDVSGLPPGNYNLRIIIDGQNRLKEQNDADNVSEMVISLPGISTVTPTAIATAPPGSTATTTPTPTTTPATPTRTSTPAITSTPSPTIFIPTAAPTQSTSLGPVNHLNGAVALQRATPPNSSWQVPIIVRMFQRGAQTCAAATPSDNQGNFSLTGFQNGRFDVRVKHANTLSAQKNDLSFQDVWVDNVINTNFGTLVGGDATGDDTISAADFTVLKMQFLQNTSCGTASPGVVPCADFNGDGTVSAADFTLLKQNFGRSGPVIAS
jgi:hypothetical protein